MQQNWDKDLDRIFQNSFENAEINPSEHLWDNIKSQISPAREKKIWRPYLMAAASVIVVIGAGLWFYRPVDVIKLQGAPVQANSRFNEAVENTSEVPVRFAEASSDNYRFVNKTSGNVVQVRATETVLPEDEVLPEETEKSLQPLLPGPDTEYLAKTTADGLSKAVTHQHPLPEPVVIAMTEVDHAPQSDPDSDTDERRIRSIGGLVNYVISKVDRREDKLIEFTDGEEGSQITGLNLGLIKLKSKYNR